jgi:hypothetical protein
MLPLVLLLMSRLSRLPQSKSLLSSSLSPLWLKSRLPWSL